MADMFDISRLTDDLRPVRRMRMAEGLMLPALGALISITFIVLILGLRRDLMDMAPEPMFFLRTGTLLLLGLAASVSVVAMARPSVGDDGPSWTNGWIWALCAGLLFPATALAMLIFVDHDAAMRAVKGAGMQCLSMSLIAGLPIAAALVLWLRKGAPTALGHAGWLTGMAAGSLGAVAYNLHCPFDNVYYVGLWYTSAITVCSVLGRLIVPRLIRW